MRAGKHGAGPVIYTGHDQDAARPASGGWRARQACGGGGPARPMAAVRESLLAAVRESLRELSAEAERLLAAASVFREPVPADALPAEADPGVIDALAAAGLMTRTAGAHPQAIGVPGQIADELHDHLIRAGRAAAIIAAHRRAANYWQWRVSALAAGWQSSVHDLLEARHHLIEAGDLRQAETITEDACSRLHAFGAFEQERALIGDTLARIPADSPHRAPWAYRLGKACHLQADHDEAGHWFRQALAGFSGLADRRGMARCFGYLGALAHTDGDFAEAERCYLRAHALDGVTAATAARPPCRVEDHQPSESQEPVAPERVQPARTLRSGRAWRPARAWQGAQERHAADEPATAAASAEAGPGTLPAGGRRAPGRARAAGAWPGRKAGLAPGRARAVGAWPGRKAGLALGWAPARWRRLRGAAYAAAAVIAVCLALAAVPPRQAPASRADPALAAAAAARQHAAAWFARWAAAGAIVACDPLMCSALRARGMPAGRILELTAGTQDPLGSDLVAASSAVRDKFGRRLSAVYAPDVAARFGAGSLEIDVRIVAPDGAAAYRRALRADVAARRLAGSALLGNPRISMTAVAARQLAAGRVDSRLLITLAALAAFHRVAVIGFAGCGHRASAGLPLLAADIGAGTGGHGRFRARSGAAARELAALLRFLRAQRAPLRASGISEPTLRQGLPIVRIEFAAPSPLGLLAGGAPAGPGR